MKTRLLKKLRKEAHKKFGICSYIDIGKDIIIYNVGKRSDIKASYMPFEADNTRWLFEAKEILAKMRRDYIINRIYDMRREKRINKCIKENKELAKI